MGEYIAVEHVEDGQLPRTGFTRPRRQSTTPPGNGLLYEEVLVIHWHAIPHLALHCPAVLSTGWPCRRRSLWRRPNPARALRR